MMARVDKNQWPVKWLSLYRPNWRNNRKPYHPFRVDVNLFQDSVITVIIYIWIAWTAAMIENPSKQHDVLFCFLVRSVFLNERQTNINFVPRFSRYVGHVPYPDREHYRFCFPRADEKLMARLPHRLRNSHLFRPLSSACLPGTIVFLVVFVCLSSFRRDTRQIASDNLS